MATLLNNKLLQQAEQRVEAGLTPQAREEYLRVMIAGLRFGLHGGRDSVLAAIRTQPDPINAAAKGAVNLVRLLSLASKGTMPLRAMAPAAFGLMLQALDFADKTGAAKVDQEALNRATKLYANYFFQLRGISPATLNKAAQMAHRVTANPGDMEQVKLHAGLVRDPNAPQPTITPAAPKPNRRARRAALRGRK